jgi:hypothetical protein
MRTVTVKLSRSLANRLAAKARQRGGSQSDVIRAALEAHLAGAVPGGSCLDLVRDLAGAVRSAPEDLSSNRRHLRGYGR